MIPFTTLLQKCRKAGKKEDFLVPPSTGSSSEAIIFVFNWNTPAIEEIYQEQVDLLFQHDYEAFEDVFNNLYSGDGVLQKIQAYRYEEQEIFEVQYLDIMQSLETAYINLKS